VAEDLGLLVLELRGDLGRQLQLLRGEDLPPVSLLLLLLEELALGVLPERALARAGRVERGRLPLLILVVELEVRPDVEDVGVPARVPELCHRREVELLVAAEGRPEVGRLALDRRRAPLAPPRARVLVEQGLG